MTSAPTTFRIDRTKPATAVIVPATDGTTLHGSSGVLDASATDNVGVTRVEFRLTGGAVQNQLIGNATLSYFGWISIWNTATVPNGTYKLRSVAIDSGGQQSDECAAHHQDRELNHKTAGATPCARNRRVRLRQRGRSYALTVLRTVPVKVALAIGVVLLVSYGYFYQGGGWNQNSASTWSGLSPNTGRCGSILTRRTRRPRARFGGACYSDKAPGQPLLASRRSRRDHYSHSPVPRPARDRDGLLAYVGTVRDASLPAVAAALAL